MKRFTSSFRLLLTAVFMVLSQWIFAQSTTLSSSGTFTYSNGTTSGLSGTFSNNNGSGTCTFNLTNNNSYNIKITSIESIVGTAGTTSADFWYKTTPINGAPTALTAANGWTLAATGTFTGIANTTTTNTTTQPFLTNLNIVVPAGATWGIAIAGYSGTSGRMRYYTMVAPYIPLTKISAGGVDLIMGTNISYSTTVVPPSAPNVNTPRGWIGKIIFQPDVPCTSPPTAGSATATNTNICYGSTAALSLNGASGGSGQTYQWEESSSAGGPFTPIAGATSSSASPIVIANTYYRCALTCSGQTSYSNPVQITVPSPFPGGYYTLDNTSPTNLLGGGTNFNSIADFVSAINCGIGGAVVLNATPGQTYTQPIQLGAIGGTSSTNTITINGNGSTISYLSADANNRGIIQLNGTDYVTVNNFVINAVSTSTTNYAFGVLMYNDADYNTINGCTINLDSLTGTSTNYSGIVVSGSNTSNTAVGSNCDYVTITNNVINGGYLGISLLGTTGTGLLQACNISYNTIKNFYVYGIYTSGTDNCLIADNDINRKSRTTVSTFGGIYNPAFSQNLKIRRNRIHDPATSTLSTSFTLYGVYLAASVPALGSENEISNNIEYNMNGVGAHYYFYNSASGNTRYYYNSISSTNQTSGATGTTYGLYQTGATTGIDIKDNIWKITRATTGAKVGIYLASGTAGITSNYNDIYVGGTGSNYVGYATALQATLANWQTVSLLDPNSVSYDPLYASESTGLLMPTYGFLDNLGTPLTLVTTDILGFSRNATTPDMGAYEFSPTACTGMPIAGTSTISLNSVCYGTPISLSATGYSIDLNISFQWETSGAGLNNWVAIPNATNTTLTYSGSLADADFRFAVTCNNSYQTAYSNTVTLIVNNPTIISSTGSTQCGSGSTTISATAATGNNVNWYANATGGMPITSGNTYTTPVISNTTTYYAAANQGGFSASIGLANNVGTTTNSGYADIGIMFDAIQPFTINSVAIYPIATTPSGNVTATIALKNAAGTILQSTTISVPTNTSPGIKTVVPLNFAVPIGNGNRLVFTAASGGGITGFIREVTTGYTFPYTVPGVASITSSYTGGASSAYYYYFYDWQITSGCEGARVPVVATVNPAPSVSIVASPAQICQGSSSVISATSTNPNYVFTWTPGGQGNSINVTPLNTTDYYLNAYDTLTGCNRNDTTHLVVNYVPVGITSVATPSSICVSGNTTVSLTPTPSSNLQYQWEKDFGSGYADIVGATTPSYTEPVTISADYRCKIYCDGNLITTTAASHVDYNNPQLLSSTGATICGVGFANLSAIASPGSTINWYGSATGGAPLATGANFTTPLVGTTTTYYASASSGGFNTNAGMAQNITTTSGGVGLTNYGIVFDALAAFTLKQVTMYPISATSASGTVTISLINSSNTIVQSAVVNVTGSPSGGPLIPQTVNLNFNIPAGSNYKLTPTAFTGITSLIFEPSAGAPSGNYGYPMVVPGVLSIKTSTLTAAPTNTPRNDLYYYFYNWQISTGCETPKVPVVVTVTPAPATTASAAPTTICGGSSTILSATSGNTNYNFYWYKSTNLNVPVGYGTPFTASPTANSKYYLFATDSISGCNNVDSLNIVVNAPTANATAVALPAAVCVTGNGSLSLSPTQTSALQYQWEANNGGGFADITGATNITYTGPVTATTIYRMKFFCGGNQIGTSYPDTIVYNNPQITGTTPATSCGPGAVTIGATATTGTNIKWYANQTGGSSLGSGNTFTTPYLTTTTTYYAEPLSGIGGNDSVNLPLASGTTTGVYYHMFLVSSTTGLTMTSMGIKCNLAAGTSTSWDIYYRPDNYQLVTGGNTSNAGWILLASTTGVLSQGTGAYTVIANNLNLTLPPGATYSFHIAPGSGTTHQYAATATGTVAASNAYAQLIGGHRGSALFNCTTSGGMACVNIGYSLGCTGVRSPVVATVGSGDPIITDASIDTICAGSSTVLTASSMNPSYTYVWTPGGQTGSLITVAPTSTTVYHVTGYDQGSSCSLTDSVKVYVKTVAATVNTVASMTQICTSGNVNFSLNPTPLYGIAYQWQKNDGTGNADIVGATNATYSETVSTNASYSAKMYCDGSLVNTSIPIAIYVYNPMILTTTPGSNCGPGSVALGATANTGATVNWFANATGGNSLATGNTYNTPSLSNSTTYYAEAIQGGGGAATAPLPAQGSLFTGNVRGFYFTAPTNFTITGLQALANTTGNQSLAVVRFNGNTPPPAYSATTNAFTTLFLLQNSTTTGVVPVNISISAGEVIGVFGQIGTSTSYATPVGPYVSNIAGFPVTFNRMGMQYPLGTTAPQALWSETGAAIGRVAITYQTGCESPRVPVTATILPPPTTSSISISSSVTTICAGALVSFTSSVSNAGVSPAYQWKINGNAILGETNSMYSTSTLSDGDVVTCDVTSSDVCATILVNTSNAITMTVNPWVTPTVVASTTNTNVCAGAVVLFSSTTTYPGSAPTYQWFANGSAIAGATNPDYYALNGVSNGDSYYVEMVSNTDCPLNPNANSSAVTMSVFNATANITASGPLALCPGGNVTLTADPASAYLWSNGATTQSITVNTAGTYSLTITNLLGCIGVSNPIDVISKPTPTAVTIAASGATTVCMPSTVVFTNTNASTLVGFDYQWKLNGSAILGATNNSYTASMASGGSITLTVTGSTCSKTSAAKTYLIKPLPVATFTSVGATTFCTGGSVTLTAPTITGYTYNWLKDGLAAGSGASKAFKLSGVYTVIATLAGCKDTADNNVTIVVNPLPVVSGLTVTPSTICAGQTALLSATPTNGILYTWVNGAVQTTSPTSTYNTGTAGTYKVIIKDANNCVSKVGGSAKLVVTSLPVATIVAAGSTTISATGSVKLTASPSTGVTIQWYKDGNAISGATVKDYIATAGGNYTVGLTKSGCTGYSSATVVTQTGIKEVTGTTNGTEMSFELSAFPNPVNDVLTINLRGIENIDGTIQVIDFNGRLAVSKEMKQASTTVDMTGFASGVYLVRYKDGEGRTGTIKITKQ